MERYRNLHGSSPITRYESGRDYIRVEFNGATVYLYTYASTGKHHVEQMKRLAAAGAGLAAYISTHVDKRYASRTP